jgi:hypothetical protein
MSKTSNCPLPQYPKDRSSVALTHTNKSTKADPPHFISAILTLAGNMRFIGSLLLLVTFIFVSPANAYQLNSYKWPQPTTTFYVDIPGAGGLWNNAFEAAMYYWGVDTIFEYQIVRETYEDPCNPPEGRNGVGFESTICGDEWGSADLAVTQSWTIGSTLSQTDIIFNSNKSWNVYWTSWDSSPDGIKDFLRVAVHELGHALGLAHEDSGVASIMRTYAGDITIPQQDDINGVASLYGAPPSPPPPPSSGDGGGGGGCFIATAAFGSPMERHVQILRDFRDRYLLNYMLGQRLVKLYSQKSPPMAETIAKSETLRLLTRWFLIPFIGVAYLTINFGIITTLFIITIISLMLVSFVLVLRKTDIFL